jgi:tetratricopeptide (TPR) repeat protein
MTDDADPILQRGAILLTQRRFAEAESFFMQSLAANPRNAQALHLLAQARLHRPDGAATALSAIQDAIGVEPEWSDLHATRSQILVRLNRREDAVSAGEKAVALAPFSVYAHSARAAALLHAERFADAEGAARLALSIDPDDDFAANILAETLRIQGKTQENADQVRAMLSRDPENPCTHASAGWSALQKGDRAKAEEHFLEALRLDPGNETARAGLLDVYKARSPLYRGYLNYCFWIQRFSHGRQVGLLIGMLLAVILARRMLLAANAYWLYLAVGLVYILFVLWSHLASAVGNFLVLVDRIARRSLRPMEKMEGACVGTALIIGLPLAIVGVAALSELAVIVGAGLVCSAIPLARTFTNPSKIGSRLFGGLATLILAGSLFAAAGELWPEHIPPSASGAVFTGAVLLTAASTWLAGMRSLREE